eukprot:TRINITY_DN7408_c0_g1_i1.p1 TRINITY_DN7408_c0_g1~~TRINITY_DN7408_c0_g1_i1.p1  ORF type:complete len:356 (-),score=41.88 TRINITY_DN7408_c0_g1_i1:95-1162(-)
MESIEGISSYLEVMGITRVVISHLEPPDLERITATFLNLRALVEEVRPFEIDGQSKIYAKFCGPMEMAHTLLNTDYNYRNNSGQSVEAMFLYNQANNKLTVKCAPVSGLHQIFESFGSFSKKPKLYHDDQGCVKWKVFEYQRIEDAIKARLELHRTYVKGSELLIEYAEPAYDIIEILSNDPKFYTEEEEWESFGDGESDHLFAELTRESDMGEEKHEIKNDIVTQTPTLVMENTAFLECCCRPICMVKITSTIKTKIAFPTKLHMVNQTSIESIREIISGDKPVMCSITPVPIIDDESRREFESLWNTLTVNKKVGIIETQYYQIYMIPIPKQNEEDLLFNAMFVKNKDLKALI